MTVTKRLADAEDAQARAMKEQSRVAAARLALEHLLLWRWRND